MPEMTSVYTGRDTEITVIVHEQKDNRPVFDILADYIWERAREASSAREQKTEVRDAAVPERKGETP